MKIINKRLSLAEFETYVNKKDFGRLPPTFLILHHTWKPTAAQWKGQKSIDGLKNYYEGKGWTSAAHLFISDDGIWLFTDMYDVGIHAGAGNGTAKTGYSVGIEVVGDYDKEVWSGETKKNTVGAIKVLLTKLNIPESKIMFHRDFSPKTCPGTAITKEWVINQLKDETMEKVFVTAIEKLLGKEYGDNLNGGEQKEIAKKLDAIRNNPVDVTPLTTRIAELEKALNGSNVTISKQTAKIVELEAVKNNGLAAMGAIRMFQEAFKQLINFK